jgi:hypothetical protein
MKINEQSGHTESEQWGLIGNLVILVNAVVVVIRPALRGT